MHNPTEPSVLLIGWFGSNWVRRCYIDGCTFLFVFFFLCGPTSALSRRPIWAKKAAPIWDSCHDQHPQRIVSPNGQVTVEVLCRAIENKDGDRARYLRVTDSTGRKFEAEFVECTDICQRGEELLWSPDPNEFLINGSETAISGDYVAVYRLGAKGLEKLDVKEAAQRDMVSSFPPCKAFNREEPLCHEIEKNPEYNMSAIDWVPGKSAIVVRAEIPCSSEFGGIMCEILGYELEIPSGKILQRITAAELKKKWQGSMAWKMWIPDRPEYGPPFTDRK